MLTDEQYTVAKAKLQDRLARRQGGEDTERLAATVKEYEDAKAVMPVGAKISTAPDAPAVEKAKRKRVRTPTKHKK